MLGQARLAGRVGWAADLVAAVTSELLAAHWSDADVACFSGPGAGAAKLAARAVARSRRNSQPGPVTEPATRPGPRPGHNSSTIPAPLRRRDLSLSATSAHTREVAEG